MPGALLQALCLVAVIEGLFLFAAPGLWRRTMEQLLQRPDGALRRLGAVVLLAGVVSLWWLRL
ncbi:DUF2065 domain-containing protein [Pseudoxanthomonas kaohsiungensis]|uniref:DUF2065 domain-containing protein n=1 Tax=Pseudoxanthomonas kaohsiungensis TaxID=283923 RepID=A0ABW3LRV8_9GAMM|nr:DUF2065 domain-containing protein [Pseudoxanthomonas kaohsiungensis]KAF1703532.1 hypothetical protein CSC66_07380 [Pseudoxanthomonas kaohsiungensis]